MKKIAPSITFIILFLISFQSFGKRYYLNINWEKVSRWKAVFSYTTPKKTSNNTYKTIVYYYNGKKYCEGEFSSKTVSFDNRHGEFIYYFISGKFMCKGEYQKGQKHGHWKIYYPEGGVERKGYYNQNKKVKTWYHYNRDQKLKRTVNHVPLDFSGEKIIYYLDSSVSAIKNYKLGKLDGPFIDFKKDSIIIQKGQYQNSFETGKWEYYRSDGSIASWVYYDDSARIDSAIYFNESGKRLNKKVNLVTVNQHPEVVNENYRKSIIAQNLNYPPLAIENSIQGRVKVKFVINPNGVLSDFSIDNDIKLDFGMEEECVRVLKKFFKVRPHSIFNINAPLYYVFPIKLKLY